MIMDAYFTVGQIADVLDEPPQRITYIIRKHRIKPPERIGITRLFTRAQIEIIKNGLHNIQIRSEF